MKRLWIGMGAIVLLSGCANVAPVKSTASAARSKVNGQVIIVVYAEPTMNVLTPGTVNGPGIIDYYTRPDGTQLKMPSPTYLLAKELRPALSQKLSLTMTDVPEVLSKAPEKKDQAPQNRNALEVFTDVNELFYRPMAWATYQYRLHAHARLVGADGKIAWQGTCQVGGISGDPTLQLDRSEFSQNDGQRLKDILGVAAKICATQIADSLQR